MRAEAVAVSAGDPVRPESALLSMEHGGTRAAKGFQIGVIALLAAIAGPLAYGQFGRSAPTLTTDYQAVLLAGGQVYYGHLQGLGSPYPVLRDIYYVRSQVDPSTRQVTNILVRRGSEWHGPDRMYLNPGHIILVEPVSPDSQVAKLIAEQQQK